jgi:hypothetical protein
LRLAALVALIVISAGVVGAATLPRVEILRPSETVCLGDGLVVGVREGLGLGGQFQIVVNGPGHQVLFQRQGQAAGDWHTWTVTPTKAGGYRVLYSTNRSSAFSVKVIACPGGIVLSSNSAGGTAMVMSEMVPRDSVETCSVVSYSAAIPATVRLYGATTGTGLDRYLQLTVTRGTGSPSAGAPCSGFVPDRAAYNGLPRGVIFRGTLNEFPDAYEVGLIDPIRTRPETWRNGESHAYRFSITLLADNGAQGLTAGQSFTWEARPA